MPPSSAPQSDRPGWPLDTPGIAYGGDYNPEQWPEELWAEDVALMRRAGVNLVSVGIFAWAVLEPEPGRYDFGWLDRVLDLLHGGGVRVALATATASPPPWLSRAHPETLPVRADGTRLWPGARQAYCPSSPVYREYAARITERIAERYREHPALALWHVDNELGCHNAHCYCDVSAAAFRVWLERRYRDVDALNDAWGTRFWSQRYGSFEQVLPPRAAPTFTNPGQQLDFRRFCSDEALDNYRRLRAVLARTAPHVPATTNFMVARNVKDLDYWSWAADMDVIANDHYLSAADPHGHVELAFSADLTRGLAGGRPWMLMEHSVGAVNWQPRNRAKGPGEARRNSLAHLARGADAVMFFQWRASAAGAEKYHSALVPHAGTDSRTWREAEALGADLGRLAETAGSRVRAEVAMVFDWQSWWAAELDAHPSADLAYLDRAHAHYRALWERGVTVDMVPPDADLSGYRLVLVCTLYSVTDAAAGRLRDFVAGGGTALVTYFSGIVDEHDRVRLGGYPGAYRELLGVSADEFGPLLAGEAVRLDDGGTATLWTESLRLRGAEAVVGYAEGPLAGAPAVTRHRFSAGTAWYAATRLDDAGTGRLTERLLAESGARPAAATRPGVEVVRRTGEAASYLFVINHTGAAAEVPAEGTELLTGAPVTGAVAVPAGGAAVVREPG
ncbi:beta-galactosidase [Allonocardiopsis opalescens]|uniref:Beta-galactosidase n=1 Tax=Allonocardiopsis opalescens TaxID=1144618 RepID=A0A2T0PX79_9ACTN|nr:beta-galactosidase [Allonocardiopsis opalescens]PRX96129.1 beta-galactosidase [Allonocardiopsis opalescens]